MLANPITTTSSTMRQVADNPMASLDGLLRDPVTALRQSSLSARANIHNTGDLEVLSAESYPHDLGHRFQLQGMTSNKRKEPSSRSNGQDAWYGGIIFGADGSSQSHESSSAEREPEPARPKKRARKASKQEEPADEDGKKQRGRPRLDTQDETAADRRRTQIRLAQRAYRNRKESTIADLKKKVTELQSTIMQMHQTFTTLHDNIVNDGMTNKKDLLSKQLQTASAEFEEFVKTAEFEQDEDAVDTIQPIEKAKNSRTVSAPTEFQKIATTNGQSLPISGTNIAEEVDVEDLPPVDTSNFGYVNAWAESQQDIMQFNVNIPEAHISIDDILAQKSSNPVETGGNSLLSLKKSQPSIERPLFSPSSGQGFYTYSFQETTFARRLHRMTLERAFRNLTNPNIDPAFIKRTFRFTFCFSNRNRVLQRFKMLLQRRAGESLENFNVPFFNIGGAGTHFPQIDDQGNPVYPPNMLPADKAFCQQDMGPVPFLSPETPRTEQNTQALLEAIGFGGTWFDSRDVEGYLKTKGIYMDGRSSFVDVDPSLILPAPPASVPSTASSISSSTGHSPILRTPSPLQLHPSPIGLGSDLIFDSSLSSLFETAATNTRNLTFAPDFPLALGPATKGLPKPDPSLPVSQVQTAQIWPWNQDPTLFAGHDWFNTTNTSSTSPPTTTFIDEEMYDMRPTVQQQRSLVTIDVEKFLERMIDGAACLGRAPGFRRELIDNALVMSLGEAF